MPTPQIIAGLDEAGRGPLAGPVTAAAVILPPKTRLPGLTDSKKLTALQREKLFALITKKCEYAVGWASHKEIDRLGLTKATELAYKRAIKQLKTKPDHLLIDGRDPFKFAIPHTSIIKGDLKIRAISAASIIAKVSRDKLMLKYAQQFPNYGFEAHKGYGTARHQRALRKHGTCPIHRLSYAPCSPNTSS